MDCMEVADCQPATASPALTVADWQTEQLWTGTGFHWLNLGLPVSKFISFAELSCDRFFFCQYEAA